MVPATLKSTGSLIITGGNPAVLLQLVKEVLNQMPPAVLVSVELAGLLLSRFTSVVTL